MPKSILNFAPGDVSAIIVSKTLLEMKKHIIMESLEKALDSLAIRTMSGVREVRHFHPSGHTMPNGSHIQRGGYLAECRRNAESFTLDESVHGEQYKFLDYRGGVIVLPTDVDAVEMSQNTVLDKVKQVVMTYGNRLRKGRVVRESLDGEGTEHIVAYSVGRSFTGKYVGDNGEMYDEKSLSVEVNGLSGRSLLRLAEMLADVFMQETVLVKDLNTGKIYLADPIPPGAFADLQ